jgi:glycolate oxidase
LIELDGDDASHVERRLRLTESVCKAAGAEVSIAAGEDEQEELWRIRKQIPWALKKLNPRLTAEDISVPVGNLGGLINDIRALEAEYRIEIPCFGHAADGNIHASPMKSADIPDSRWDDLLDEVLVDLYTKTAAAGGTISGEHGIGHKRKPYLHLVMEPAQIQLLQTLKRSIDPNNILNPGKIFDLP